MKQTSGQLHGVPVLWLESNAFRAALSLHGGQLLSFTPEGCEDLLWLSPASKQPPGAVRGGVPVCWPYFGREGQPADVPQHGFARTSTWLLDDIVENAGELQVEMSLPALPSTPLRLRQQLHLKADGFSQSLTTTNSGEHARHFTQALHSYFRVADTAQLLLQGVDGLRYADRYDGGEHLQQGDWSLHDPRDPGRSDRTYREAQGDYLLQDTLSQRAIRIRSEGSHSLVVWNPGAAGIAALGDVPVADWRHFVCVEVANAGADVVTLAAGASHTLRQHVSCVPLR